MINLFKLSAFKKSENRGFSLVELIVAIAIMAMLAASSAPLMIRYVDKARKAMDVQTASVIYRAAELAYTSGDDDAYDGYTACYDYYNKDKNSFNRYPASIKATADGYFAGTGYPGKNDILKGEYALRPIAWCRGTQYTGTVAKWENTYFKSIIDNDIVTDQYDNKINVGMKQRKYTDELLWALVHDSAKGGSTANRNYDNLHMDVLWFRFNKEIDITYNSTLSSKWNKVYKGKTKAKAECWVLYRRDDTGMPEVWIGQKDGSVWGTRRMYPNPNPDYR